MQLIILIHDVLTVTRRAWSLPCRRWSTRARPKNVDSSRSTAGWWSPRWTATTHRSRRTSRSSFVEGGISRRTRRTWGSAERRSYPRVQRRHKLWLYSVSWREKTNVIYRFEVSEFLELLLTKFYQDYTRSTKTTNWNGRWFTCAWSFHFLMRALFLEAVGKFFHWDSVFSNSSIIFWTSLKNKET